MKKPLALIASLLIGASALFVPSKASRLLIRLMQVGGFAVTVLLVQGLGVEAAAAVHVTGTVVDRNNQPIQNVTVQAVDPNDNSNSLAGPSYTGLGGDYQIDLEMGTAYTLQFFSPCCQGLDPTVYTNFTAFTDQILNVQVGPFNFSGVVRDVTGAPVKGVRFQLAGANGQVMYDPRPSVLQSFMTTSDGAFNLVVPSGNVHLIVSGNRQQLGTNGVTPDNFSLELIPALTANVSKDMTIETAGLTMTSKDQFGRAPIPGNAIHADGQGMGSNLFAGAQIAHESSMSEKSLSSNGTGVGTLTVLKGLTYNVSSGTVGQYGYATATQTLGAPLLTDQSINLTLLLNALSGRIVDRNGQPVVSARIDMNTLTGGTVGSFFSGFTDANGFFIASAQPGIYRFTVRGDSSNGSSLHTAGHVPTIFSIAFEMDLSQPTVQDMTIATYDVAVNAVDDNGEPIIPNLNRTSQLIGDAAIAPNLFAGAQIVSESFESTGYNGHEVLPALPGLTGTITGGAISGYDRTYLAMSEPFTHDQGVTLTLHNNMPIPEVTTPAAVTKQSPVVEFDAFPGINQYWIYRDGIMVSNLQLGNTPPHMSYIDTTASEGVHQYQAIAINVYGVKGYKSNTVAITYDKTRPTVSTPVATPNPGTATLAVGVSTNGSDNLTGIAGGEYYLDSDPGEGSGVAMSVSAGTVTGSFTPAAAGSYVLNVRVKDGAGNWSLPKSVTLVASEGTPDVPVGVGAISPTRLKPNLTWGGVVNADHYDVYRNDAKVGTSTTTNFVDSGLGADGTYTYKVTAVSAANLESAKSAAVSVAYDTFKPVVVGTPDNDGWHNADVALHWTATDPAPSSGVPTQPADTTASLAGVHIYDSGQSCDPAGNCATGQVTLKIDKSDPTVGSVGILTKTVGQPLGLSVTADDGLLSANSGVVGGEYFVGTDPGVGSGTAMAYAGGALGLTAGDNTFTNLVAGVYQVGVRSRDASGRWSAAGVGQLTVILPAPAGLMATSPTSNAPMLTWSAVPTATSYRVYREANGATVLAGTVSAPSFTDTYAPGVYVYTVVAVNATAVTSAPSAGVQVAVISPTSAHANEAKASGKTQVVPVYGADVLPGLVNGSTTIGSFDFDMGYTGANGAFQINNNFTFMYDAGVSHFLVQATSIPWLVVNGASNTHGIFQGDANVTVGTAAAVSRPFTVEVDAGSLGAGRFKMTIFTDSSRSTVLYRANELLDKGKIDIK